MKGKRISAALLAAILLLPLAAEAQRKPASKVGTPPATTSATTRSSPAGRKASFSQSNTARTGQSALAAERGTRRTSMSSPVRTSSDGPALESDAPPMGAAALQRLPPVRQSSWRASGATQQINTESNSQ
jgi:hypothetical protein